jgi:hypothetical protein
MNIEIKSATNKEIILNNNLSIIMTYEEDDYCSEETTDIKQYQLYYQNKEIMFPTTDIEDIFNKILKSTDIKDVIRSD